MSHHMKLCKFKMMLSYSYIKNIKMFKQFMCKYATMHDLLKPTLPCGLETQTWMGMKEEIMLLHTLKGNLLSMLQSFSLNNI